MKFKAEKTLQNVHLAPHSVHFLKKAFRAVGPGTEEREKPLMSSTEQTWNDKLNRRVIIAERKQQIRIFHAVLSKVIRKVANNSAPAAETGQLWCCHLSWTGSSSDFQLQRANSSTHITVLCIAWTSQPAVATIQKTPDTRPCSILEQLHKAQQPWKWLGKMVYKAISDNLQGEISLIFRSKLLWQWGRHIQYGTKNEIQDRCWTYGERPLSF